MCVLRGGGGVFVSGVTDGASASAFTSAHILQQGQQLKVPSQALLTGRVIHATWHNLEALLSLELACLCNFNCFPFLPGTCQAGKFRGFVGPQMCSALPPMPFPPGQPLGFKTLDLAGL